MSEHEHIWTEIAWLPLQDWKVTARRCDICHIIQREPEEEETPCLQCRRLLRKKIPVVFFDGHWHPLDGVVPCYD